MKGSMKTGNNIQDVGAEKICKALEQNSSVTSLYLKDDEREKKKKYL